jgi:3-oxoacyl-[acyl-carrier protein] reductase
MSHERIALITGAANGIGAATAARLARDGATIVALDTDELAVREACAHLEATGSAAIPMAGDVRCAQDRARVIGELERRFGRIDVLINNAGIMRNAQLYKMPADTWSDVIDVDLLGPMGLVADTLPLLQAGVAPCIVNVASRAMLGGFGQTNYAASKAGLVGLTRSLAIRLGASGIRSNAVAPGFIDTAITSATPPEVRERARQTIPLGRVGTPDDVAEAIAFLASPASSYVTGQCLYVCGGRSLLGSLETSHPQGDQPLHRDAKPGPA